MSYKVVQFDKQFEKQLAKLPARRRGKAINTLNLFLKGSTAPSLRRHPLKGDWLGYESISAGGDLRLHFKIADDMITFVAVGTHSQLYK